MDLKINAGDIRWWFWAATLAFIVAAVTGWEPGYHAVIAISALHAAYFVVQEKSLSAFPVQTRLVYLGLTLFGLWPEVRLPAYGLLLVGTVMVTFFDRCAIALVLKHMPWNQGRELRLN
jgi:hypothetical protein